MFIDIAQYLIWIIVALAIGYAAFSIFIQRKLSNPKRIREIQRKVNENQKKLNEMIKSGAPKEAIQAKQKDLMPNMSEMMKYQIKPMLVILPSFVLLYWILLPNLISSLGASKSTINFILPNVTYQSFFIILEFIIGIAVSIVVMVYDRRKGKQEALQEQSLQNNS
jgi:uncharacterized membrane protein (DUF106 family)